MKATASDAFKAMYYALDAAYNDSKNKELASFLTDANPLLFNDEGSADPAVFIEFEQAFIQQLGEFSSAEASLEFVRSYLGQLNQPVIAQAFDSIVNSENWAQALDQ